MREKGKGRGKGLSGRRRPPNANSWIRPWYLRYISGRVPVPEIHFDVSYPALAVQARGNYF